VDAGEFRLQFHQVVEAGDQFMEAAFAADHFVGGWGFGHPAMIAQAGCSVSAGNPRQQAILRIEGRLGQRAFDALSCC
jgi:hypothetical protein